MKKVSFSVKSRLVEIIEDVTNFKKYKCIEDKNRKPKEEHIKTLMDSFRIFGTASAVVRIIRTRAINGVLGDYIADGQHSIKAAERLSLGLTVIIVELVEDTALNITQYIAMLNNNSKAWSTNNFLGAYSSNEISEYKIFDRLKKQHGLTITDLLHIFLGGAGTKENKLFKSGELKFDDCEDSMTMLEAVVSIINVIPKKSFCRRSLYKVMRLAKDYKRLAKAILKAAVCLETAEAKFSENEFEFHDHLIKIYKKEFKNKVDFPHDM